MLRRWGWGLCYLKLKFSSEKFDRKLNMSKKVKKGRNAELEEIEKAKEKMFKESRETFWSDFKKFITKGNVLDMAVAVVVGTAFNAIVTGLVKNIITPVVTYFTSGVSINEMKYVLKEAVYDAEDKLVSAEIAINYGLWIQTVIDFMIIAFSVFIFVRTFNNLRKTVNFEENYRKAKEEEVKRAEEKLKEEQRLAQEKELAEKRAAIEAEFYQNTAESAKLLREIKELLSKTHLN